jgi:hypothetical protein
MNFQILFVSTAVKWRERLFHTNPFMDFLSGPFGGRGKSLRSPRPDRSSHHRFILESIESYAEHENLFGFSEGISLDQISRQIIGPMPVEGFYSFIVETRQIFVKHIFDA